MSSRNNSIEINDNRSSSSLTKLILLSKRTIRYSVRVRCCYCIPIILFELLFPLLIIGIIICFSHYLLNTNQMNNSVFDSNQNETCSDKPLEYLSDEMNSKKKFSLETDCLNIPKNLFPNTYSKTNLIIRFLNISNENNSFFDQLMKEIEYQLRRSYCLSSNRTNILLWNNLLEQDDSILFNENNGLNVIIDIHQFSSKSFQYDIIIQMPEENSFLQKLQNPIDISFFQRHQHPSEQIDVFGMSYPPFSNVKMFIDSIVISILLNENPSIIPSWSFYRITCTSYRHHKTIPTRWTFILMEISLSITFLFYSFIISYFIIEEKIQKIKQILQIIHIQPFINYLAWALRPFCILSFIILSITGLWKISIGGWIVFEYVSSSILLLTFTLLNIQLISFSILMGQLFNSMTRLFLIMILIWITMNILSFKQFYGIYQFILCLNPYFSFMYIFRHLFFYERSMNHVDLYKRLNQWTPLLSNLFFIIFSSIPFYWILIWYWEKIFPGEYGIALKWNFPFSIQYWKSNRNRSILFDRKLSDETLETLSDQFEDDQNSAIVQIESLYKYFPETNRTVVNNVQFNLYENQITALLGHNGAGKTTIMNMLCGMCKQSGGSIKICNYDTIDHMEYLRQFISYCPQHDILFDYLTVEEQIEFHAIAKGFSADKEDICTDLLQSVSLTKDRNVFCKNLSGGMKRRLSIACAFIGNTKLVLLDEPSSGLDPINRRLLWTWIREMKENRTILLSTHFMEEADALCDRIIILSNGKVRANDTTTELKRLYGTGYKLIINTLNNENNSQIFEIIENILLNSTIESETNDQLIIATNEESSSLFIKLLNQLEILKEKKFILNYGLANTTLDEVFLQIANDENENNKEDENFIEENCSEIFNEKLVEDGYEFYLSQYQGLIIKSFRIAYRSYILFLFICFISFFIEISVRDSTYNIEILFDFNDWSHFKEQNLFISFIQIEQDQFIFDQIKYLINERYPLTDLILLNNITNIVQLNQLFWTHRKWDQSAYSTEYIGLLFENSETISILTSHLITGYESFSLVSQYLCRGQCSISTRLKFIQNRQKNLNKKNFLSFIKMFSLFSCFYGVYPGEMTLIYLLTYNLIYIYISILIISEGKELIKLMRIFGLHPIIYWTARYFFDLLLSIFYSFILYGIFSLNNQQEFYQNKNENSLTFKQILMKTNLKIQNQFFLFTFILATTTLPPIYLITKLMKNELIGGLLIYILLILIEIFDLIRVIIIIMTKNSSKINIFYWLMNIIFPPLNSKRIISILLKSSSKYLCKLIEKDKDILSKIVFVKEINANDLWKHFCLSLIHILVLFVFLCLIDLDFLNKKINLITNQFNQEELDDDVLQERIDLLSNKQCLLDDPFVCIDITKKYPAKDKLSINHLTFHVQHGQCFGLLGFNGAGKTSLFKIIVGEEKPSHGSIYINGKTYVNLFDGICRDIGYCPQYDCIVEKLTLEDYLYLFGRVRGIFNDELEQTIETISKLFLLDLYLKQYLKQLSGGTIRRMHAAIACIGYPNIILLDEPTTGVDPYSRRRMREIFEYALNSDITMILTSHSMDECEMLCSRLGIMSEGQFKCLGNIQELKRKFGNIYSINIKLNSSSNDVTFQNLYVFLKQQIQIQIHNQTESTIIFQVENISPAKLFALIESIKDKFYIETYSIQQMTLEQIFISLQNSNN